MLRLPLYLIIPQGYLMAERRVLSCDFVHSGLHSLLIECGECIAVDLIGHVELTCVGLILNNTLLIHVYFLLFIFAIAIH